QSKRARRNRRDGSYLASHLADAKDRRALCVRERLRRRLQAPPFRSHSQVNATCRVTFRKKSRVCCFLPRLLCLCFTPSEDQPCCAQHEASKSCQRLPMNERSTGACITKNV